MTAISDIHMELTSGKMSTDDNSGASGDSSKEGNDERDAGVARWIKIKRRMTKQNILKEQRATPADERRKFIKDNISMKLKIGEDITKQHTVVVVNGQLRPRDYRMPCEQSNRKTQSNGKPLRKQ